MIVCLMGPAGSGKSTLAKELERVRPELFARVPVDYFFEPRPEGKSMADYLARPFTYDWAADRVGPVAVLDGMRPHPRCDLLVLLDLDREEQRRRLVERDRRWGTAVAERHDHLAATFRQGLTELPRDPDLRLRAETPSAANLGAILDRFG